MPAIHRRFDYVVPASLGAASIAVGHRVRVNLHGRRVAGWIVETDVEPEPGVSAKAISRVSGMGPPAPVVSLAEWAAWRWAGPLSSFLGTASPDRNVAALPSVGAPAAPGRVASPGGESPDLVARAVSGGGRAGGRTGGRAVVRLAPALDERLVVLEVVHRFGSAGVLVLAPSHARAEAVAGRLRDAGTPVAVLPDDWARAATGVPVVVGTRAAAWAPTPSLRAAVILGADDDAYREERSPTWSAVDVVVERARRDRAPCLLVTPCPTVVLSEGATLVTSSRGAERRGWPVVEVVDRRGDDPRTGLFSHRLVRVLADVLSRRGRPGPAGTGRVVCVLNRTGRSKLLACVACGELARCARCGGPVGQPGAGTDLVCGRCGETRPAVCDRCDSTRFKVLRVGVARATEELAALTGVDAVEVTATRAEGAATSPLVVGTEAALHRAGRVEVVAFLDLDQHLLAPRFGAAEETLSLLARAARLTGGREGERPGRVLVQTRLADHPVLAAALRADPSIASAEERAVRIALDLPPFGVMAALRGEGAAPYGDELSSQPGVSVSALGTDRLARAGDHRTLCDALAATPRPQARLRVEVDPTDV